MDDVFVILNDGCMLTASALLLDDFFTLGFVDLGAGAFLEKTFAVKAPKLAVVNMRCARSTLGFAIVT